MLIEKLGPEKTRFVYAFSCELGGQLPYIMTNHLSFQEVKGVFQDLKDQMNVTIGAHENVGSRCLAEEYEEDFNEAIERVFPTVKECHYLLVHYLEKGYLNFHRRSNGEHSLPFCFVV